MLPVAMIGISARPADGSTGRLHQLREDAEGGRADVFCKARVRNRHDFRTLRDSEFCLTPGDNLWGLSARHK
jgi:hypothetical protein